MKKFFCDLSIVVRITLTLTLVLAVAVMASIYLLSRIQTEAYLRDQTTSLMNRTERNAQRLADGIDAARRDVLVLSRTPPIQRIREALEEQAANDGDGSDVSFWLERMQDIFLAFASGRPEYFQLRYIGIADAGRELVRVNVTDGRPVVAPAPELQSKADRDYFQATLSREEGEVYVSNIDLNQENGVIQVPHIRTLRAATPVFSPSGELFGIIVINMDVGPLFDRATTGLPPGLEGYIANDSGDFLVHVDTSRAFGFDLGQRYTWQDELPGLQIPAGFSIGNMGLQRVRGPGGAKYLAVERLPVNLAEPQRFLLLIYALPEAVANAQLAGTRNALIATAAGIGVMLLAGLFLFLRRTFSPLTALTEVAARIGAGDYQAVVPRESTGGGLGSLIGAFRRMRDDINAREQAVRQSEAFTRATMDALPANVCVLDEAGTITLTNRAWRDFAADNGCDPDRVSEGANYLAVCASTTGSDSASAAAIAEGIHGVAIGARDVFSAEYPCHSPEQQRWFGVSARRFLPDDSVRVVVCHFDITVRVQAERRIRGQLEHLKLLDHITGAIGERQDLMSIFQVVVRSLEDSLPIDFGCVCTYDAAAHALTVTSVGVKSDALANESTMTEHATVNVDDNGLGRCVRGELVYEADIEGLEYPFPKRLAQGGLRSLVMAPLKSESRVFGVLVAARHAARSFSSVDCEFLRQLSEHVALAARQAQVYESLKQAYEDLRQTQEVMMQEERLKALGQMASGIAHDINNALSPVALYTESMLETEPNLSERSRGHLQVIQRAVEDVAETVVRMREFCRPREQQLELTPVALNTLVQQVIDLTQARWSDMAQNQGIEIKPVVELAPELPMIMGVESEIREALTNLIFNAVDAMPQGGTLTLRTRVSGADADESVVVEVVDTGVGMDEATRLRCLEPFFTTKGERGTGLGLAMVFGMTQRHSSVLEIDSAPGEGTTIRLIFAAQTTALADTGQLATLATPSRLRLLLIDDDPMLLKSLRDALEVDGHIVVTANGGERGIEVFRTSLDRGERFAAVITDLGMPYVDGRRVAEAVKETSPSTLVIMLTGWGRRLEAEGDVPLHVDRMLAKPPKLRELRETLASLCGGEGLT